MSSEKDLARARDEGASAKVRGRRRSDCPYPSKSDIHAAWQKGWRGQ